MYRWPVIIGIIIGSLIVFSILWCFVRCLCCGKDLVCCCFKCCSCCQPSRSHRDHKHLDSVPPTPYNNQYQSHAPPAYAGAGAGAGAFSQTATFESSTRVHEDSLPAMPSWETAASHKVEVFEEPAESHEMEPLKESHSPSLGSTISPRPIPPRSNTASNLAGAPSPKLPGAAYDGGHSPYSQPSPYGSKNDMYGSRPDLGVRTGSRTGLNHDNDYLNDPYSSSAQTYGVTGGSSQGYSSNQGYSNSTSPYRDNYGSGRDNYTAAGSGPRSPGYAPSGSTAAYDFATGDRYDRNGAGSRTGGGNAGYQTYSGNNSNPYGGSNSNQYGGGNSNQYNSNQSNYNSYGNDRKPVQGSWRDI